MSMPRYFVAPGKLVLVGEYAVLDGAPAIALAVDRGVCCEVVDQPTMQIDTPEGDDRFVRPALATAPPAHYRFTHHNPTELREKPGFGGSAAASGLSEGNAFIGFSGFFLSWEAEANDTATLWIFQMVFASAVAERTRINAYLAYSFIVGAIIYPFYGLWVWGGGWLGSLPFGEGAADFAGSGVVHTVGGMIALAGAMVVGPRIGKYNADGTVKEIPGHNIPFVLIGTFILFFGWFGFNAGSTLARTDLHIATIATNTLLAGATGAAVVNVRGDVHQRKTRPAVVVQRRPGRTRGDHGAVRLRCSLGRRAHQRDRGRRDDAQPAVR